LEETPDYRPSRRVREKSRQEFGPKLLLMVGLLELEKVVPRVPIQGHSCGGKNGWKRFKEKNGRVGTTEGECAQGNGGKTRRKRLEDKENGAKKWRENA